MSLFEVEFRLPVSRRFAGIARETYAGGVNSHDASTGGILSSGILCGSPSCRTKSRKRRPDSGVGRLSMMARAGSTRVHQTTSGHSFGLTRIGVGPRSISIGPAPSSSASASPRGWPNARKQPRNDWVHEIRAALMAQYRSQRRARRSTQRSEK